MNDMTGLAPSEREDFAYDAESAIAAKMVQYRLSPEFAAVRREQVGVALSRYLCRLVAMGNVEREAVVGVLAAALDEFGAGLPESDAYTSTLRSDAKVWADFANPVELEAYAAASLAAIANQGFGIAARKRLMIALWNSLTPADKQNFIARVSGVGPA